MAADIPIEALLPPKLKKKRRMHPNSLKNLNPPVKAGEVLNPKGINNKRPYSVANLERSTEPVPEPIRMYVNATIRKNLGAAVAEDFESLPKGITWSEAIATRFHIAALLSGDVGAGREVRESVEGKASQRLEITGGEGKPLMAPDIVVNFVDAPPQTEET